MHLMASLHPLSTSCRLVVLQGFSLTELLKKEGSNGVDTGEWPAAFPHLLTRDLDQEVELKG